MMEELQEACGLFGCISAGEWPTNLDIAHIIHIGLVGLQHRGQESGGIVTSKGNKTENFASHKGMGLVGHVFKQDDMSKLKGNLGIGHTRYSTHGASEHQNIQPFVLYTGHGLLALAHNGQLVNAKVLREKLLARGIGLFTASDSELLTQLLSMPPPEGEPEGPKWPDRIRQLMSITPTAYSLLIMCYNTIYAVRDPYGNRPLCIGELIPANSTCSPGEIDGWVVSSESCCFPSVSARFLCDVEPGQIIEITKHGPKLVAIVERPNKSYPAFCIFEYVYFARPDSFLEGRMVYGVREECGHLLAIEAPVNADIVSTVPESATPAALGFCTTGRMVYGVREECGRQLAIEAPVNADIVSTVPESATPAALGFAQQSGLPYTEVLCRNRYVGRTFIQPTPQLRELAVAKKFGPLRDNFDGKRIVLIDDSIVRGNTTRAIISLLKKAGAKEVHIRIASPPLHYPCYMGINIPTKEELIANRLNPQALAEYLKADSLIYLSVDGLISAVQKGIKKDEKQIGHCTACLTGNYPVELEW